MPISAHPHPLKAWTARFNGWQRLWLVLTLAWTLTVWLGTTHDLVYSPANHNLEQIVIYLLLWLAPPILLYAGGLVVRWVYRGFRPLSSERRKP